jgi:hypothetical protein
VARPSICLLPASATCCRGNGAQAEPAAGRAPPRPGGGRCAGIAILSEILLRDGFTWRRRQRPRSPRAIERNYAALRRVLCDLRMAEKTAPPSSAG